MKTLQNFAWSNTVIHIGICISFGCLSDICILYTFVYCSFDNISGCSCVYKYIICVGGSGLHSNVYINERAADALCIYKVGWVCIALHCIALHCVFIRWAGFVFTTRGHWHADLGGTYGTLLRKFLSRESRIQKLISYGSVSQVSLEKVSGGKGWPYGMSGYQGIRYQVWGWPRWPPAHPTYGGMSGILTQTLFYAHLNIRLTFCQISKN